MAIALQTLWINNCCCQCCVLALHLTGVLCGREWLRAARSLWREATPEVTLSSSCLKQGHLELVAQGYVQLALGHLHRWRLHDIFEQLVPVFVHPQSEKAFSSVSVELPLLLDTAEKTLATTSSFPPGVIHGPRVFSSPALAKMVLSGQAEMGLCLSLLLLPTSSSSQACSP